MAPDGTALSDSYGRRGMPSLVWRAGQSRRFEMIMAAAGECLYGRVLDAGCGMGMYMRAFAGAQNARQEESTATGGVFGVEIEPSRVLKAAQYGMAGLSVGESLPFRADSFMLILSHEVLEHVSDDRRCLEELVRVLEPGGRLIIFVPNRWWFFETHGCYWRGKYHFGNIPMLNYLPDSLRNRLAPHVRAYSGHHLKRLLDGLPLKIVSRQRIFPGFDNVAVANPFLGRWLRRILYRLEKTPLQVIALSHFWVLEKTPPR